MLEQILWGCPAFIGWAVEWGGRVVGFGGGGCRVEGGRLCMENNVEDNS